MKNEKNTPATTTGSNLATAEPKQLSASERFTAEVMKQFSALSAGSVDLTNFQKKLATNYFIKIDQILKENEVKRAKKDERYRDPLAFTWANVNLTKLAVDVIAYTSVGLDPAQPNQIFMIPYKNSASNKFDFGFIMGYKGIELKAKKYGNDVPDDIIVEVVYSTDNFKQIKRDMHNKIEGYVFEVVNDFDRGSIVGGFYYHVYNDTPHKNKLRVFNMADIEKRKPEYASADFWGGEKDKWENGKKAGKEKVEGWLYEMVYKTLYRAAWNAITIDSEKIDDNLQTIIARENDLKDSRVLNEIKENANRSELTMEETEDTTHEDVTQPAIEQGNQQEEEEVNNAAKEAEAEMGF